MHISNLTYNNTHKHKKEHFCLAHKKILGGMPMKTAPWRRISAILLAIVLIFTAFDLPVVASNMEAAILSDTAEASFTPIPPDEKTEAIMPIESYGDTSTDDAFYNATEYTDSPSHLENNEAKSEKDIYTDVNQVNTSYQDTLTEDALAQDESTEDNFVEDNSIEVEVLPSYNKVYTPSTAASRKDGSYYYEPTQAEIRAKWKALGLKVTDLDTYKTKETFTVPPNSTDGGRLSDISLERALNHLNFIRYIAGVADDVELDETFITNAQKASYLNWLNENLSHYPERPSGVSDSFYNDGYNGAQHSNLGARGSIGIDIGANLPDTLAYGWAADYDQYNVNAVGHRIQTIKPELLNAGFGLVPQGDKSFGIQAMHWDYARKISGTFQGNYLAWPAKNMPYELYGDLVKYPFSVSLNSDIYQKPNIDNLKVTIRSAFNDIDLQPLTAADDSITKYINNSRYLHVDSATYSLKLSDTIIFYIGQFDNYDTVHIKIEGLKYKNGTDAVIEYDTKFFSVEETRTPATGITISATNNATSVRAGETIKLTANLIPSNATQEVYWFAQQVDGTGNIQLSWKGMTNEIKALDPGKVRIKAVAAVGGISSDWYELTITEGDRYDFVIDDLEIRYGDSTNSAVIGKRLIVRDSVTNEKLEYKTDYTVSRVDYNSSYVRVYISGKGKYEGRFQNRKFDMKPAILTVTVSNLELKEGEPLPDTFDYTITGFVGKDTRESVITKEPTIRTDANTSVPGIYRIYAEGAECSSSTNYEFEYIDGELAVEPPPFVVSYDISRSIIPKDLLSTVKVSPSFEVPYKQEDKHITTRPYATVRGYRVEGWYKDATFANKWDFAVDTVNSDITLYAKFTETQGYDSSEDEDKSSNSGISNHLEDLSFAIADESEFFYTGSAIKPDVIITDGDKQLIEKRDYTISYKYNTNAWVEGDTKMYPLSKRPFIKITGKGNYTGSVSLNFEILPLSLEDEDYASIDDGMLALGKDITKYVPAVYYKGKALKNKKDFQVDYSSVLTDNYNAPGIVEFPLKGVGNYTGNVYFSITLYDSDSLPISNVKIEGIKERQYENGYITFDSSLVVKYKGVELDEDQYTISYNNNYFPGKGYVIITGTGISSDSVPHSFVGTKRIAFNIIGSSISKVANVLPIQDVVYNYNFQTPDVTVIHKTEGRELNEDDYKLVYSNNKNPGNATVSIIGQGEYYGSKITKKFKIKPLDISKSEDLETGNEFTAEVIPTDESGSVYYTKGGATPSLIVKYNGIKLNEGTDYTVKYTNNQSPGTATAIIKGKGMFSGTKIVEYKVVARPLNKTVMPVPAIKAGTAVSKIKTVLMDTNGNILKPGIDYLNPEFHYEDGSLIPANTTLNARDRIIISVEAKENGCYVGTLETEVEVGIASISAAKVDLNPDTNIVYSGDHLWLGRKDLIVSINNGGIVLGDDDYVIISSSYKKNLFSGNASCIIVGKGNYAGYKKVTFKIYPRSIIQTVLSK